MISIDRLEEMTIEELQTKLKNFEEQIKLQNNFIDSLFKATNNSEWLDKSMLDDEVSEVIEKIELDYEQLDQLKAEVKSKTEYIQEQREIIDQYSKEIEMYKKCQGKRASKREEELKSENERLEAHLATLDAVIETGKAQYKALEQTLTEIKEIVENGKRFAEGYMVTGEQKANVLTYANAILQKISEVIPNEN